MAANMRNRRARTTVDRLPAVDNLDLQIEDIAARFKEFSESVKAALSIEQVGEFLEANGQALSGSDDALLRRCQDLLFYGPLEKCPVCHGNNLEFTGSYCACATCIYRSKYPPRKRGPIKYPISIVKQINPRFNPDWDPPYVEGQGFFARFWSDVLRPHNPREAARVEITLNIFQDGMREINGRRMNNITFWIYVYVGVTPRLDELLLFRSQLESKLTEEGENSSKKNVRDKRKQVSEIPDEHYPAKRQKDAAQKPNKAHGKDSDVLNPGEQTVEKIKPKGHKPDIQNEQRMKERVPEETKVYADQCTAFVSNINLKASIRPHDVGGMVAIRLLHDKFNG
ncbi:unnamed protein product [Prunus armeniaca]|uniref:PARP1-like PADR1 domain-containing protein n=1 Tax=Prunus armeniaca TaxID=36596 RepID=A0A6J5V4B7_PRUAR|nr:unnamed protein product [Prunus armeniaca]